MKKTGKKSEIMYIYIRIILLYIYLDQMINYINDNKRQSSTKINVSMSCLSNFI